MIYCFMTVIFHVNMETLIPKIAEVPTCLVVGLLFCPAPRGGATGIGDVGACLRDMKSVLSY